jgi:hypothetical protein
MFRQDAFSLEKRVPDRLQCRSRVFDLDYNCDYKGDDEYAHEMGLFRGILRKP